MQAGRRAGRQASDQLATSSLAPRFSRHQRKQRSLRQQSLQAGRQAQAGGQQQAAAASAERTQQGRQQGRASSSSSKGAVRGHLVLVQGKPKLGGACEIGKPCSGQANGRESQRQGRAAGSRDGRSVKQPQQCRHTAAKQQQQQQQAASAASIHVQLSRRQPTLSPLQAVTSPVRQAPSCTHLWN